MTAVTVQLAIQAFLAPPTIPNLNTVTRAPIAISGASARLPNGVSKGASSYVWLELNQERVISVGGAAGVQPNGWRMVDYNAAVIFDWEVVSPSSTNDSWIDDLNAMTEAIKTRLRSDPTLGTAGEGALTIFSAADEFPLDDPSISVVLGEPQQLEGTASFLVHGAVVFPVHETVPPG